jgi:hypothetical protein
MVGFVIRLVSGQSCCHSICVPGNIIMWSGLGPWLGGSGPAGKPCALSDWIIDTLEANAGLAGMLLLPHAADTDVLATTLTAKLPRLVGPPKGPRRCPTPFSLETSSHSGRQLVSSHVLISICKPEHCVGNVLLRFTHSIGKPENPVSVSFRCFPWFAETEAN